MSKQFIVTGGLGFIGRHLVERIFETHEGAEVLIIDPHPNLESLIKNKIFFKRFNGRIINKALQDVNSNDLSSLNQYGEIGIFHLGAITDTTYSTWKYDYGLDVNNISCVNRLFDILRMDSIPLIYASSASVYGNPPNKVPFKETDPTSPQSLYALSKVCLESRLQNRGSGFRFFNVIGKNEEYKNKMASYVYQMANQEHGKPLNLIKDGTQTRDFVHVDDVVSLLLRAYDKQRRYGVYNLGSGKDVSYNRVEEMVSDSRQTRLTIKWIDNPYNHFQEYTCADMSKVKEIFDWEPKYPGEKAIEKFLKDFYEKR
jgi:ADP-L-glycero-D-manno-heptose 6-epimerase